MAREIDLLERQKRLAWYLILPAVFVVFLVIGFPLAQVIVYSFMKIKLDGYRMATRIERGRAKLLKRTGLDWKR